MYSKFFIDSSPIKAEQGFLLIELLIGLIILSIAALGTGLLLVQNRILAQQTEWGYRAALSASNILEAQLITKQSSILEWQDWLSETFPNSKISFTTTPEGITVKCLPPPHSKLKVIEIPLTQISYLADGAER